MLLNNVVIMKSNTYMKKYYEDKGYNVGKRGNLFIVKVEDLPNTSNAIVWTICDFCHKIHKMKYCKYVLNKDSGICCKECKGKKAKNTCINKYGVENTSQLESTKQKRKSTCLEKYGCESNLQSDETKDKIKQTCLNKYGVEHTLQNKEIQKRIKDTCIKKYGFDNPMKNNEIKQKVRKSMFKHGTCECSKPQYHLYDLYGGILNYSVDIYNLDIYLPDNKIYIEYSGGGHNLQVKFRNITDKEFKRKNIYRYNKLKSYDLKMIEFISHTDKFPNDDILIQMKNEFIHILEENDYIFGIVYNLDTDEINFKE